tara:strand:- start:3049 stop:3447 length:399 start_codon:yes stop_codon:yes gene_type:complete
MKVRLTLIVTQYDDRPRVHNMDNTKDRFSFFINDNNRLPSIIISSKNEEETLQALSNKYFYVAYDWMNVELCGFRRSDIDECEAIYIASIPNVAGITKTGQFISDTEAKRRKIKIGKYYEQLLSRRSRRSFR